MIYDATFSNNRYTRKNSHDLIAPNWEWAHLITN